MNSKIERTITEIERLKAKISASQAKLRALEQQKTSLENAEIIALYRKENFTEDELRDYLRSRRDKTQSEEAPNEN